MNTTCDVDRSFVDQALRLGREQSLLRGRVLASQHDHLRAFLLQWARDESTLKTMPDKQIGSVKVQVVPGEITGSRPVIWLHLKAEVGTERDKRVAEIQYYAKHYTLKDVTVEANSVATMVSLLLGRRVDVEENSLEDCVECHRVFDITTGQYACVEVGGALRHLCPMCHEIQKRVGQELQHQGVSRPMRPNPRFVYMVCSGGTTRYKIGIASDVSERIKALQTGNHERLVCVTYAEVDDARSVESTLHHQYRDLRVCGEWFEMSDEIVSRCVQQIMSKRVIP